MHLKERTNDSVPYDYHTCTLSKFTGMQLMVVANSSIIHTSVKESILCFVILTFWINAYNWTLNDKQILFCLNKLHSILFSNNKNNNPNFFAFSSVQYKMS